MAKKRIIKSSKDKYKLCLKISPTPIIVDPSTIKVKDDNDTSPSEVPPGTVVKVMNELNNNFITVPNVTKNTGIQENIVNKVIFDNSNNIVVARGIAADGEKSYATQEAYKKNTPFVTRVLNVIKGAIE